MKFDIHLYTPPEGRWASPSNFPLIEGSSVKTLIRKSSRKAKPYLCGRASKLLDFYLNIFNKSIHLKMLLSYILLHMVKVLRLELLATVMLFLTKPLFFFYFLLGDPKFLGLTEEKIQPFGKMLQLLL